MGQKEKQRKQKNKLQWLVKMLIEKGLFVHKIKLRFHHLKMNFVVLSLNLLMNNLIFNKHKVKEEKWKLIYNLFKENLQLSNNNLKKQKKIWNVNVNVLQNVRERWLQCLISCK